MKKYYSFAQVLFLITTMQTIAVAQQLDTIQRDSSHSLTYEKHSIWWGKVYDQGHIISPTAYQSIIRLNQSQALQHFDQYQTHIKQTKNLYVAFIILYAATNLTNAVAERNGYGNFRQVVLPYFAITSLALAGLGLHKRSKAQKELKQSVLSVNQ